MSDKDDREAARERRRVKILEKGKNRLGKIMSVASGAEIDIDKIVVPTKSEDITEASPPTRKYTEKSNANGIEMENSTKSISDPTISHVYTYFGFLILISSILYFCGPRVMDFKLIFGAFIAFESFEIYLERCTVFESFGDLCLLLLMLLIFNKIGL